MLRHVLRRLGSRRPALVVRPINGIGNRMRAIASADAFARRHGLALSLCWEPSHGFSDVAFEDLFANRIPRLAPADVEALAAVGTPRLSDWCRWQPGELRAAPAFDPTSALARIRADGLIYDQAFMDLFSLLARLATRGVVREGRAVRRAYRRFRVAPPIAQAAERFAREHFGARHVVGVHIRRGDAFRGPIAGQFAASTDAAFAAAMDQALESTRDVCFFLATDDPEILVHFEKRYPGRTLAIRKEFVASEVDAPKAGQVEAVLELALLAKTRWVLGTQGSTFGRGAARMGGIRFRAAVEGGSGAAPERA